MTLCALGLTYFGITFSSALIYKLPPDNHADYVMAGKAANAFCCQNCANSCCCCSCCCC